MNFNYIIDYPKIFILKKSSFFMDYIKEAFNKVKQDMDFLKEDLNNLKNELKETRELMIKICENVQEITNQIDQTHHLMNLQKEQITKEINPAHHKNIPADNSFFKPLNGQNQQFSTGNCGVPADRQTNQQTDRQVEKSIENAVEMIKSLDNLKKEISKKFKKLTDQEWLVFSAIYQFDEERGYSDYRMLSDKLNLTESSIRDYVARLIKKGISINKNKLNNKNVQLKISPSLKQIASLSTILALREV